MANEFWTMQKYATDDYKDPSDLTANEVGPEVPHLEDFDQGLVDALDVCKNPTTAEGNPFPCGQCGPCRVRQTADSALARSHTLERRLRVLENHLGLNQPERAR